MTQRPGRWTGGLTWWQVFAIMGLGTIVALAVGGVVVWIISLLPRW